MKFNIREGSAGIHFLSLEPVREDYRDAIGCDSLHFLVRDGISFATLEALVRDLNSSIETLAVQKS